jgi:hypothetical protein
MSSSYGVAKRVQLVQGSRDKTQEAHDKAYEKWQAAHETTKKIKRDLEREERLGNSSARSSQSKHINRIGDDCEH